MDFDALREAIASDNPGRARPALASLVNATPEQAEPLLLLGLQQNDMLLRQLSCSGLGHKPTPAGWQPLVDTLQGDPEVAVRAEAARLGLPVGLTGLAESGLFIAAAVMMGWIGTAELAAHGIAMELTAVAFMVHLGLGAHVAKPWS